MDIAFALLSVVAIWFIATRRKHRLLKLLLVPSIVPAAFLLWVQVIAPHVPAQWTVFEQEMQSVHTMVARSYSVLKNPAEKEQLINDFKSMVEIDENGERNTDPELAEKYGDIQVPGILGDKLEEAKSSINQRNDAQAGHMSSLGQ